MTITDPHYKPDAPYAFVTKPGSALDHLSDAWQPVPAKDGLPPYAIYTKTVEQSPNDDRAYRCAPGSYPGRSDMSGFTGRAS